MRGCCAKVQFSSRLFILKCVRFARKKVIHNIKRVKEMLPPKGHVCIMHLTDKQFGMMEEFLSRKKADPPENQQQ